MRIFFIGASRITASGAESDTMEAHIVMTLHRMGHHCAYFPYKTAALGGFLNSVCSRLAIDLGWIKAPPVDYLLEREIAAFKPDIVLTLLGNYTSPATIKRVRRATQAPVVCWVQDHMGTMGRQYVIGSGYDFIFAKDWAMVELLTRYTRQPGVRYLAEACNPEIHRPLDGSPATCERYRCEITTAGTLYYYRSAVLEALTDFDLKVWGAFPRFYEGGLASRHAGGSVYGDSKALCFRTAKIVVNTLFPTEINGLNARAFEAAGCGAFQLISYSPAVERHFTEGVDIEVFRDLGELRDKARHYLQHDGERQAIADEAAKRARAEHTYEIRLQQLLDTVFGGPSALSASACP